MTTRVHLPMIGTPAVATLSHGPSASASRPGSRDPLLDPQLRRVRYLRVSVTDRCNYRCVYCMPADAEHAFAARAALLTFEEITSLATVFAGLGVRKLRLTGGEPTVRADLPTLVRMLADVAGIDQLVMTSNGHLLDTLAAPLAAAGLHGVNISIDSVDPDRFRALTGRGDLAKVLAGIDAAIAAGLTVKLNAVAVADDSASADADLLGLCTLAWDRALPLRFIEPMPMSSAQFFSPAPARTSASIRASLEARLGQRLVAAAPSTRDAGPARYWHVDGDPTRTVGIISAMSDHFCDDCNRLRLTATGDLYACLGHDDAVSLRDVLRHGGDYAAVRAAIDIAVRGKRVGHVFEASGAGAPDKSMISMGG